MGHPDRIDTRPLAKIGSRFVAQYTPLSPEEMDDVGAIRGAKDVSRKVKLTAQPPPAGEPEEGRAGEVIGRVVLRAVLCRTGEVTDIEVVEGLPDGLTEKALEAAKQIKFVPAERRGQKVSQRALFEYTFRHVR